MARPRRIEVAGGWYHLTSRGIERRDGHLLQERYRSVLIGDEAGVQEVVRYVHLNPVRVGALQLGKPDRATEAARMGLAELAAEVEVDYAAVSAAVRAPDGGRGSVGAVGATAAEPIVEY
jgi:hypothetical protein